jgi:hypothetical protein
MSAVHQCIMSDMMQLLGEICTPGVLPSGSRSAAQGVQVVERWGRGLSREGKGEGGLVKDDVSRDQQTAR